MAIYLDTWNGILDGAEDTSTVCGNGTRVENCSELKA